MMDTLVSPELALRKQRMFKYYMIVEVKFPGYLSLFLCEKILRVQCKVPQNPSTKHKAQKGGLGLVTGRCILSSSFQVAYFWVHRRPLLQGSGASPFQEYLVLTFREFLPEKS